MKTSAAYKLAKKIQLAEGLEMHDLARVVNKTISIDAFTSKMGDDADICVLGFVVSSSEPGEDLVSFIERGYDFVLDADCSPGENSNGEYYVFVELERSPEIPTQVIEMVSDLVRLTDIDLEDWRFTNYKSSEEYELTDKNLRKMVILTPEEYEQVVTYEQDTSDKELSALKHASGIKTGKSSGKKKDPEITALQAAAGVI